MTTRRRGFKSAQGEITIHNREVPVVHVNQPRTTPQFRENNCQFICQRDFSLRLFIVENITLTAFDFCHMCNGIWAITMGDYEYGRYVLPIRHQDNSSVMKKKRGDQDRFVG